jgi:hypothetical protein
MKIITLILLVILSHLTFAQAVFTVDGFAKDYYGKVEISDTSEVFSKGWVAIYDRRTDKQIIKVVSDELALSLHDSKAIANIKSLPYGEQSLIMYDDFNFDGKKDFAVGDGQNSCYHGPSFKIYLAIDKGFSFNEAFTRLAQEYCGMFQVDYRERKIYTMTKSGCCWHESSEFVIENNRPKAVKVITEEHGFPFNAFTEQTWNGKQMVEKTTKTIDTSQEGIRVMLSFIIPENGKKVILYNVNDRTLNYVILRKDSTVEFSYPIETIYENYDFKFDGSSVDRSVTFKNKNATYKIYDKPTKLGIEIIVDGKTYKLIGDNKTKIGGLDNLLKTQLDNVISQK